MQYPSAKHTRRHAAWSSSTSSYPYYGRGSSQVSNEVWAESGAAATWTQAQHHQPWSMASGMAHIGMSHLPAASDQDSWPLGWQQAMSDTASGSGSWSAATTWQSWQTINSSTASISSMKETAAGSDMAGFLQASGGEDDGNIMAMNLLKQLTGGRTSAFEPAQEPQVQSHDPQSATQDGNEDDDLAMHLSSAVAMFLAGDEGDESDQDVRDDSSHRGLAQAEDKSSLAASMFAPPFIPENSKVSLTSDEAIFSSFTSASIDAEPFFPVSTMSGQALAPKKAHVCLVDALAGHATAGAVPSDGTAIEAQKSQGQPEIVMPTLEGMNDFLTILRRRPLPPELCTEEGLMFYQGVMTSIVIRLYRDRIMPKLAVVQQRMRDRGCPEPVVQALLPLCARDCPHIYNIQPPMRGEQPVIYLNKAPLWFQGFVDVEAIEESALIDSRLNEAVWASLDLFLKNDHAVLPAVYSEAALVLSTHPGLSWLTLAELEHLILLAIGRKKLSFFGDYLLPARVVTSYQKKMRNERIKAMNMQQQWNSMMPTMPTLNHDDQSLAVSNSAAPLESEAQPVMQQVSPYQQEITEIPPKLAPGVKKLLAGIVSRTQKPAPRPAPTSGEVVLDLRKSKYAGILDELMTTYPVGVQLKELKSFLKKFDHGPRF